MPWWACFIKARYLFTWASPLSVLILPILSWDNILHSLPPILTCRHSIARSLLIVSKPSAPTISQVHCQGFFSSIIVFYQALSLPIFLLLVRILQKKKNSTKILFSFMFFLPHPLLFDVQPLTEKPHHVLNQVCLSVIENKHRCWEQISINLFQFESRYPVPLHTSLLKWYAMRLRCWSTAGLDSCFLFIKNHRCSLQREGPNGRERPRGPSM